MEEGSAPGGRERNIRAQKICARRGCGIAVKKPTAKYCSVRCCAIDPERLARLRTQTRRANARPLTMTRQLALALQTPAYDPEAQLAELCQQREDVPAGMSRLAS